MNLLFFLFRDFADLENVLELEEAIVSLCYVFNSTNAALSQTSVASDKNLFLSWLNDFPDSCFGFLSNKKISIKG